MILKSYSTNHRKEKRHSRKSNKVICLFLLNCYSFFSPTISETIKNYCIHMLWVRHITKSVGIFQFTMPNTQDYLSA